MKTTSKVKKSEAISSQSVDYTWRMYEILISEQKHQHNVWLDNFRVVLTFNSILLPGSFAAFALIIQGKASVSGAVVKFLPWTIVALSIIGVLTTAVMMIIIARIQAMTALRQKEIRKIELKIGNILPIHPFLEGFALSGGVFNKQEQALGIDVKPMKWYWFRGQLGYNFISIGFIVAYAFLGIASIVLR